MFFFLCHFYRRRALTSKMSHVEIDWKRKWAIVKCFLYHAVYIDAHMLDDKSRASFLCGCMTISRKRTRGRETTQKKWEVVYLIDSSLVRGGGEETF